VFLVLAPWWPSQESDQAKINFPNGIDLGVHVYKVSGQSLQRLRNVPANERTAAATSSHRLTTVSQKGIFLPLNIWFYIKQCLSTQRIKCDPSQEIYM
jgi:hypothetical protein